MTAIDFHDLPSHVTGQLFGGEVEEGADAFIYRPDPAHRNRQAHGFELLGGGKLVVKRRADDPGRDRIDPNFAAHQFLGQALGGGADETL